MIRYFVCVTILVVILTATAEIALSCEPYSKEACEQVAKTLGTTVVSGAYDTYGCYRYRSAKGVPQDWQDNLWYGEGGTVEQMQMIPGIKSNPNTFNQFRPVGYDCSVGCMPYSEQACRKAAKDEGYQLGDDEDETNFIGDYVTKGCYAYRKKRTCERWDAVFMGSTCRKWRQDEYTQGRAYYSTGGSLKSMKEQANGGFDQIRPDEYDCIKGIPNELVNPGW